MLGLGKVRQRRRVDSGMLDDSSVFAPYWQAADMIGGRALMKQVLKNKIYDRISAL